MVVVASFEIRVLNHGGAMELVSCYSFDHLSLFVLFEVTASLSKYENVVKVFQWSNNKLNSRINVNSK